MYDSLLIARKFLSLAKEKKASLTPMQLIKLVYLSHGWMLGLHNKPLIREEVQAWQYGPVIPELYHAIKHYRSLPVQDIEFSGEEIEISEEAQEVIKKVYEKYGDLSGIELSMMTHESGSPWEITRKKGRSIMSNDLIAFFYKKSEFMHGKTTP